MRGGLTEEEAFPQFEEFEVGEGAGGGQVELEGGEGFFAGWAVWMNGLLVEWFLRGIWLSLE